MCEFGLYAIHTAMPTPICQPARKLLLPLVAICALPASGLFAGTDTATTTDGKSVPETVLDQMTPLDLLDVQSSYVGTTGFTTKRFNGDGAGTQQPYGDISETEEEIEYGHRFNLFGKVYLRLGFDYQRFDFTKTSAPVPLDLQNICGEIQLEYVVQGEPALFFRMRPGVFFSNINQVNYGSIDVPMDIGGIIPADSIIPSFKKVYVLVGAHVSFLSKYPVFPIGGVVWLATDKLRVEAIPPEPRVIYSLGKHLEAFAGGELLGQSYKRASDPSARPQDQRFSDAVLDFTEYRGGAGLTFKPIKAIDIDLSGGWDFQQDFDYYRGNATKQFETHGAPYAKLSVDAEF